MARTLKPDWVLFVTALALVLAGVIMVFSSSAVMATDTFGDPNHYSFRQVVAIGLGLLAMFLLMRVDYHEFQKPGVVFPLISSVTILLIAAYFFPAVAETHRWIPLFGGFSFQPAELAKLSLVVFAAYTLDMRKDRVNDWRFTLIPVGAISGIMLGLIVFQPDLGTVVTMVATLGLILFAAGLHVRWLVAALILAVPAFHLFVVRVPWRYARIEAFIDPWSDPLGKGFQLIQSLISVGSGGILGRGLGEGQQKLFFLPEPHTDFIFAVVGEELGLIGATVVLSLFGLLFWRGLRASSRAPDEFGSYLALGITLMVVLQAAINVSVALGLLPTTGISLPFLSYGGSSMLIMLGALGILMNVSEQAGA
jgi:cell division protein FtsW